MLPHITKVQKRQDMLLLYFPTGPRATWCHKKFKNVNVKSTNTCQEAYFYLLLG